MNAEDKIKMDMVHAMIGRTISFLLKSGQSLNAGKILATLHQRESESLAENGEIYKEAKRMILDVFM